MDESLLQHLEMLKKIELTDATDQPQKPELKSSLISLQIDSIYKRIYKDQFAAGHKFKYKSSKSELQCEHCYQSIADRHRFNEMYSRLYPDFTNNVRFDSNQTMFKGKNKGQIFIYYDVLIEL